MEGRPLRIGTWTVGTSPHQGRIGPPKASPQSGRFAATSIPLRSEVIPVLSPLAAPHLLRDVWLQDLSFQGIAPRKVIPKGGDSLPYFPPARFSLFRVVLLSFSEHISNRLRDSYRQPNVGKSSLATSLSKIDSTSASAQRQTEVSTVSYPNSVQKSILQNGSWVDKCCWENWRGMCLRWARDRQANATVSGCGFDLAIEYLH